MSTEVLIHESRDIVITTEQTELLKQTICRGATDAEMRLFFYDCQRRGVHPLDKLIHFTKRGGKYTPITSIDFFRIRAQESKEFAGEEEPLYTEIDGRLESCKYTVYRFVQGQRCQWTATARWREYYPGDGDQGFMWRKMPYVMLTKCAEALALRKAFPAELQGLYVKEEMDQAGPIKIEKMGPGEPTGSQEAAPLPPFKGPVFQKEQGEPLGSQEVAPGPVLSDPQGANGASPAPPADPAEAFRPAIRMAHTAKEAKAALEQAPEALRQDLWTEYTDKLKQLMVKTP